MKAPPIFIVVQGHADFHHRNFLAWFFDEQEARTFAKKQPSTEYSGCSVEEVPAPEPMPNPLERGW